METNPTTIIAALIVGVPLAVRLGADAVKWLMHRTVETEDKAKAALSDKVENLERDYNNLRREFDLLKQAHDTHRSSLVEQLGSIGGRISALDERIAKSGEHYQARLKESISELNVDLNRKLTALLGHELPDMVRDVLREERRQRGARK